MEKSKMPHLSASAVRFAASSVAFESGTGHKGVRWQRGQVIQNTGQMRTWASERVRYARASAGGGAEPQAGSALSLKLTARSPDPEVAT